MISTINLTKKFGDYAALNDFSTSIKKGCIYGLVGTNGSGKSTLMRNLCGIYSPDEGRVTIDGEDVFENVDIKNKIVFVPDDLHFLQNATLNDMAKFYKEFYSTWSDDKFRQLSTAFPINPKKKINTFSKGMKRQVAIILAISAQPDYLLLDEAFDGLDPVIRVAVRKIIADEVASREMTVIIASHNLRELEDLCDYVGILHMGKLLVEKELDELKLEVCKVQAAFKPMIEIEALQSKLNVISYDIKGSIINMVVKGDREDIITKIHEFNPVLADTMSLTLEEVFINEMEAVGYDYNNIIF